jgi:hypothetical protein
MRVSAKENFFLGLLKQYVEKAVLERKGGSGES